MDTSNFKYVKFKVENGVGCITLDDKETKNAVSALVAAELLPVMDYCQDCNDVKVVLIQGANDTFSAGGNIRNMKERVDKGLVLREGVRNLGLVTTKLLRMTKPTVACVEGAAAGGSLGLALACDYCIAAEDTKFTVAFVNIALVPDMGTLYLLTKTIGMAKAKELIMTGKLFTGKQAADWGIIAQAVPQAQLKEETKKIVDKFVNGPTITYGRIKQMLNNASYIGFEASVALEVENQFASYATADHKEAVTAFFEKRKPDFTGK